MIYQVIELFFINIYFKLFTYKVKLISFLNMLSLINLIYIYINKNLQLILKYFKINKFIKHDYSDCL